MADPKASERREFVRVRLAVPVRYAFTGEGGAKLPPGVSEGSSANLSVGGLLLQGKLHDLAWAGDLLTGKSRLSLSLQLPGELAFLQTSARVAWIETVDPATRRCNLGLAFEGISREDQDRIQRFVMRSQLS